MNVLTNRANFTGWLVFLVTFIVYFFAVERTGSLWDCGEFVLGAYKLQIVHPPGASLFLMTGRLFTWVASLISNNPSDIAFSVNLMSALSTSIAAMCLAWMTIMLGRIMVFGRGKNPEGPADIAVCGAGLVTGLVTAFSTSIWFSAVEGEVYAMSTMFTGLTLWAATKWYYKEDSPSNDKWLIFALYATGLSIGVHLLSLLTFPHRAIFIYYKEFKKHSYLGLILAALAGVVSTVLFQKIIISGIPSLWAFFDKFMVNSLGLPFHSGLIPTILVIGGLFYWAFGYFKKKGNDLGHKLVFTLLVLTISFSSVGVVLIRANANPPINMNAPTDVMRLLPYLNREQYGERPLLKGPHFDARPIDMTSEDRWGRLGNKYAVVDRKMDYVFSKKDEMFLPRISHNDQGRTQLHRMWMDYLTGKKEGTPSMAYNLKFMWNYQFGWMYWRYFMWNFVGRQNAEQGFYPWNVKDGNWFTGIKAFDSGKLYNQDRLPRVIREDQSRNGYYFLPLILGILGVIYNFRKGRQEFWALFSMWLLAGLGLCFFNNSPPNEPRERDYVLIGSFMIFCVWIGMGVLQLYEILSSKAKVAGMASAGVAIALALTAPVIMASKNMDDLGRNGITAARDYAINILESCRPNAILFTYGDNDTYPVWYAQEVEGVRRDVRVINLSLIAVDWYIDSQRRKINDSAPVKMSIPSSQYRGMLRNQIYYYNPEDPEGKGNLDREMDLGAFLKFIGEDHKLSGGGGREFESFMPTHFVSLNIPTDVALKSGMITAADSNVVSKIPINLSGKSYITKDELAILDILYSNIADRPIYFSVTCHGEKLMGLSDYVNMDGMALRIVPVKSISEKNMSIYGAGKMDLDFTYDVVMNKYKWGNFDKKQLFVDHSYAPSVQAIRMVMMRLAEGLQRKGDLERAGKVAAKFFEVFPNMNFQYDARVLPFVDNLIAAGNKTEGQKQIQTLADETLDMLEFYSTLSPDEIQGGFEQDQAFTQSSVPEIIQRAKLIDPSFGTAIESQLKKYIPASMPN